MAHDPRPTRGLADMLEPEADPVEIQDFAFADTVYASELESDAPHCMTPLAFPLPLSMPADDVSLATRLRVLLAHARHAIRGSVEEMRGLWADTNEVVEPTEAGTGRHLRRALALWSFFHWSRGDVTRAALIGLAVFISAAALSATTMDFGSESSAGASNEVRGVHTLDQHTGKNRAPRSKR